MEWKVIIRDFAGLSDLDELRAMTVCTVCSTTYYSDSDHRPLHLPSCEHTACSSCVKKLLRQHGGAALNCPVCDMTNPVPSLADLPEQQIIKHTTAWLKQAKPRRKRSPQPLFSKAKGDGKVDEDTEELAHAKALAKDALAALKVKDAVKDMKKEKALAEEARKWELIDAARSAARAKQKEGQKSAASSCPAAAATAASAGPSKGKTAATGGTSKKSLTRELRTAARTSGGNLDNAKAVVLRRLSQQVTDAALGSKNAVLVKAANDGQLDIVRYLVEKGADIEQVDEGGESALNESCRLGHLELVRYLLLKGADPNHCDSGKRSPLYMCTLGGHLKVVELLAAHCGPQLQYDTADYIGNTPLMVACGKEYIDVARCLLDNGADVNCRNGNGVTPLHICASGSSVEFVKLLLSHGADARAVQRDGCSPRDLALRRDRLDVAHCIEEWYLREEH